MARLRWALVALLIVSSALFAIGAIAERSQSDERPAQAEAQAPEEGESEAAHHDEALAVGSNEGEQLLGVHTESAPLIIAAVVGGLALAALAATPLGKRPAVLIAIALVALTWAALDIREAAHQLDESRSAIAALAVVLAALHLLAAAIAGRLATAARGRAGTMRA